MLTFLVLLATSLSAAGVRPRCGGLLTAARGVLQTPLFPNDLPVPIRCEWVIDSSQNFAPDDNTSIVVYLTQLYVHEGLKFTEYQVYDTTYQLDGKVIHVVNETNAVQVRWVQSFQNFLVITLQLDTIDGTHLRVLDRFLDVYGFNITYEIARGSVRTDSCTMMDCGFTGICYDHYTKFSCDCFEGYSGSHCSSGAKSFCSRGRNATCKNGGTCMHVGVSAVKCHCQVGFTGETCQIPVSTLKGIACQDCIVTCPFDGKLENACKCKQKINTTTNNSERTAFTCTMHLSNFPSLTGDALKSFIQDQVFRTLKGNYSKLENVRVESVGMDFRSSADVTFHLFAVKKDEKRLKMILGKWAERGYIANLTVADKQFVLRPLLDLQSVSINHEGVIRERDEFILSCVARGSTSMYFRWFKDGIFVNVTENISHKWSRLIKDPYVDDQYTAILGVESARILDGGTFSCQVEDFGVQQCLSRRVTIKSPPLVKVEPMSLTVRKGANVTIKCISVAESNNKYTYSWTKNKELLPVRTEFERYEILYPSGSILRIFNVEKTVTYSCLVQDAAVSSEVKSTITVIGSAIQTCPTSKHLNVTWTETAPDTDSLQECPKGYAFPGFVRRSCTLNDGLRPIWLESDYSRCTWQQLHKIEEDFQLLRLGYDTATPIQILGECSTYLKYKSTSGGGGLLPGEGTPVLHLVRDIIRFVRREPQNITNAVFAIVDAVLQIPHSLINQQQVELLQEVVNDQTELSSALLSKELPQFHQTFQQIQISFTDDKEVYFKPYNDSSRWFLLRTRGKITNVGVVVYKNLTAFLPTRSVIRLKDGTEAEYEIVSQIVRIFSKTKQEVSFYWKHNAGNFSRDGWYLQCASSDAALFAYSWNTTSCNTYIINNTAIKCSCPNFGTHSILLTSNNLQIETEEEKPRRYAVLAGCSVCFLCALTSTIVLTAHWMLRRSCIVFLKLQCSVSVAGVMLTFLLVTINEPSEGLFVTVMALIEILLLMGMSAHVSTLLIIYTELVRLPKAATSKETVIGISTGVPVIAVFGNHLAHRTMDVKLKSWWLLAGTLAFNIFVTVSTVLIALFLLLYFTVFNKIKKLTTVHEKEGEILHKRIVLLRRSACVFTFLVIVTTSSIFYIHFVQIIWWHYEFCLATILLGVVLVVSYVAKSEITFHELFKEKEKERLFGVESTGSPLNFFTKEDAEVESESIPNRPHHQSKPECVPMSTSCKSALPECVSGTMETSYAHIDPIYCGQSSIERYNHSPQLYRKNITFKIDEEPMSQRCRSPDIIASKICTQLDIVASHAPSIIITPEESIAQILSDDAGKNNEVVTASVAGMPETTQDCDKLDGMLDRISHDLDYLLNRGDPLVDVTPRRPSKSNIQEEVILEECEDETKLPEAITDILRTNC